MLTDKNDDRAAWAQGYGWAARLITISLEMALPPAAGHALDIYLHTHPWLLIFGALLGLAGSSFHLLQIVQEQNAAESRAKTRRQTGTDK